MSSQRIETEEGDSKEKKWKLVSALLIYDEVLHDVRNTVLHDVRNTVLHDVRNTVLHDVRNTVLHDVRNPMLHDVRNIKFQSLSYVILRDRPHGSTLIIH